MTGWLSAYRALDLTDARGVLAGQMMAKLGVDVIQVEPKVGSNARRVAPLDSFGNSFYWSAYGAGKRSITLDLEQAEGRELFLQLVDGADFLFESADPCSFASLGLSYEALHARNPALIHVSITPFGSDGPKRDYAYSDLTSWASGGPLHPNRDASGPPLRLSVPQAFLHGAADGATGAMMAHFARLRTGRGQHVDISVQQSITQATLGSHLAAAVGHEDFAILAGVKAKPGPKSVDLSGSGSRTRRSKWKVSDGLVEMHLSMGPSSGAKTNSLFTWMKAEGALPPELHGWDWKSIPDLIIQGDITEEHLEVARNAVAKFLAPHTRLALQDKASERGIMLAAINEIDDLLTDRHLLERGYFVHVKEGNRDVTLPGRFAVGPDGMFADPSGAPALGQHNDEVFLGLLGLDPLRYDALREREVI
jgi:crotonobetainyl-CoA:carnitine CoA-transferase CaiB-like acyl-CoA transferase